jgi:hypothetical protein
VYRLHITCVFDKSARKLPVVCYVSNFQTLEAYKEGEPLRDKSPKILSVSRVGSSEHRSCSMTEDFVDRDLSDNQYVDLQTKIGPVDELR